MIAGIKNPEKGAQAETADAAIRLMLVDDSAIIRGLIARMVSDDPDIEVVASVGDGAQAVKRMEQGNIDVIVLDIEMPVMDGLTALPKIIALDPNVKIIMASTLTERNADVSIRALGMGAADYVPKPTSTTKIGGASDFRRELVEKIKSLGAAARGKSSLSLPGATVKTEKEAPKSLYPKPVALRRAGIAQPPEILAVGCSTGGPQALHAFFGALKPDIGVPVVVTQHMPPTFTRILAEHIAKDSEWTGAEAQDGDVLQPNRFYMAPGDFHMVIEASPEGPVVRINQDPKENFCRPAVDPMFRSVAKTYTGKALAVILTGMGSDGLKGSQALIDAGGTLIAQDEESSIVWGMPGAVSTAGLCTAVLPINGLVDRVMQFFRRNRR